MERRAAVNGFTANGTHDFKILRHPQNLGLQNKAVFDPLTLMGGVFGRTRINFCLAFAFTVVAAGELRARKEFSFRMRRHQHRLRRPHLHRG
jgi:hypothetical protein